MLKFLKDESFLKICLYDLIVQLLTHPLRSDRPTPPDDSTILIVTKKIGSCTTVFNSSSHTRFNISGLLKIQTLLKVRQGQYKNFLLQWLFYIELWGWDMAQNVNLRQKMRTEKTEKRWYFLKDDDHRWLFDNRNVGDNYWKTGKTWHFVTQGNIAC